MATTQRRLGEMTWMEVEDAIASGRRTAVLPTGSTEQHGPHLPLLTDTLIADAIAERLAERLDAIAAPSLFIGCSEHHMGFAGSATLSPQTFVDTVEAYVLSLAKAGFELVVAFSAHAGNVPYLDAAHERLDRAARQHGARAVVVGSTERFAACFNTAVVAAGLRPVPLPHADAGETSLLAAIRPDLVRFDRIQPGQCDLPGIDEVLRVGLRQLTANGVLGDPTGANAEVGERILGALIDDLCDHVETAVAALDPPAR